MNFLKQIIREELQKVLSTLNETDFYSGIDYGRISAKENPKESIIYNYEKGRAFAGDNLEVDIANLNRYHLVDYLPNSETQESWSFEFDTVYGTILIIDINRIIKNEKSFWSMKFGQLYKGEQTPTMISEIGFIEDYENFISVVNNKMSKVIDPAKY